MKVSPRLVAANYILELSSQELQQQIATELSENPALELVEMPTCRVCGTELQGSICPRCIQRQKSRQQLAYGRRAHTSPYDDMPEARNRGPDDEEFDPLTRVASEQTLAEKLLMDMGAALPDEDMPIAEYLVGSLDEKGYLVGQSRRRRLRARRRRSTRCARCCACCRPRSRSASARATCASACRSRSPISKSAACRSRTRSRS